MAKTQCLPCRMSLAIFITNRKIRGEMPRRTFKYRLYPNHQQQEMDVCRELYNAGLQERRDAWSTARKRIGYVAQANQLGQIKSIREDIAAVHSQVLQDTLRRLDKTFQAFFLRCQRGQKLGFPRCRSKARYDSFTYPQSGYRLNGRLLSSPNCRTRLGALGDSYC